MVIVASGIARGRVRTAATATVESRKMAAILQMIAELRQPGGPPSGAPYPYRKLKEVHELIFSW